jgi:hypothetical protein
MRPFRITLIVCAIAALLVTAGCGGGSQPATAQPPTAQPAARPTATQPKPDSGHCDNRPYGWRDYLSQSSQPGGTIAGTAVEQIVRA